VIKWFQEGGMVMWILLIISLISWCFIFERLFFIMSEYLSCKKMQLQLQDNLSATDECLSGNSQIAKVLRTITNNQDLKKEENSLILRTQLKEESVKLHSGLTFLEITASISPLLGLLGTVLGMVEVFSVIAKVGVGDPLILSSGISKALTTTVFGLIVAIPALTAFSLFERKIENIIQIMEKFSVIILTRTYANKS